MSTPAILDVDPDTVADFKWDDHYVTCKEMMAAPRADGCRISLET